MVEPRIRILGEEAPTKQFDGSPTHHLGGELMVLKEFPSIVLRKVFPEFFKNVLMISPICPCQFLEARKEFPEEVSLFLVSNLQVPSGEEGFAGCFANFGDPIVEAADQKWVGEVLGNFLEPPDRGLPDESVVMHGEKAEGFQIPGFFFSAIAFGLPWETSDSVFPTKYLVLGNGANAAILHLSVFFGFPKSASRTLREG
jgi:hypothetical protein